MAFDTALIAFGGVFAGLWLLWRLHFARTMGMLPPELRTARLIYAERLFRSVGPVSITAKIDRVYRNEAGGLVLLELKTRWASRAYLSDIIELSAQRIAVMTQTGEPVAEHAYVLTESPDGRKARFHRVMLMAPAGVVALALRRQSLLVGETEARRARWPGVCRTCAFLQKCSPPRRDLRSPCA